MIYDFKSRATGTVTMLQSVAEHLLEIIGKTPGPKGIITVDQMPAAVVALRTAIEADRHRASAPANAPDGTEAAQDDAEQVVSLEQRAFPLIEMLEQAHSAGKDITWGV
ncbi:MAG: DUF1840 domain-containing protein [Burkholderiaceae bacterium]|nr:DUF1840 domain-containing protein [Burkholderiaceae bacterium]